MTWFWLLVAVAGCYLLKLAGLLVPARILAHRRVRAVIELLPVAMLGALIALQSVMNGREVVLDARLAGLAVAGIALLMRAPFLVVVVVAAVVTAAVRAFW